MSDASITHNQVDPQDWTVSDLQQQLKRLREQLSSSHQRMSAEVDQLSEWAAGLPVEHVPEPHPVRLADLASTERDHPLSLARRVIELARLLARADALAQTLMRAVEAETGSSAPDRSSQNRGSADQPLPALEPDEMTDSQIMLIAHCGSAWGDDDAFERQRQLVRRVMTFDGNRTWHGRLPSSINDGLPDWQTALNAAEAGAHVQIKPLDQP